MLVEMQNMFTKLSVMIWWKWSFASSNLACQTWLSRDSFVFGGTIPLTEIRYGCTFSFWSIVGLPNGSLTVASGKYFFYFHGLRNHPLEWIKTLFSRAHRSQTQMHKLICHPPGAWSFIPLFEKRNALVSLFDGQRNRSIQFWHDCETCTYVVCVFVKAASPSREWRWRNMKKDMPSAPGLLFRQITLTLIT